MVPRNRLDERTTASEFSAEEWIRQFSHLCGKAAMEVKEMRMLVDSVERLPFSSAPSSRQPARKTCGCGCCPAAELSRFRAFFSASPYPSFTLLAFPQSISRKLLICASCIWKLCCHCSMRAIISCISGVVSSFMSVSGKLVGWRFPSYRMTDMFGPPPGGQREGDVNAFSLPHQSGYLL